MNLFTVSKNCLRFIFIITVSSFSTVSVIFSVSLSIEWNSVRLGPADGIVTQTVDPEILRL